jgi:hypothetical protein
VTGDAFDANANHQEAEAALKTIVADSYFKRNQISRALNNIKWKISTVSIVYSPRRAVQA